MKRFTRDDTEHGKEYYLAEDFDAAQQEQKQKHPLNCGTGYCSCIECVMMPPPKAWLVEFENGDQELHFDEQSAGETNTPLYAPPIIQRYLEKDNPLSFQPDWANFQEGRAVGWTEAFEQIADKIKAMPWETDTKDSFIVWLKEQA